MPVSYPQSLLFYHRQRWDFPIPHGTSGFSKLWLPISLLKVGRRSLESRVWLDFVSAAYVGVDAVISSALEPQQNEMDLAEDSKEEISLSLRRNFGLRNLKLYRDCEKLWGLSKLN